MTRTTRAVVAEGIFALAFLLLGLFVIFDALTLPEPGVYSAVSPKTFALIIGIFTTTVAALLLLEVIRGRLGVAEGTEKGDAFLPPDIRTMTLVLVAILLHVLLLERAGYILAASLTFFLVAFAFGSRKYLKDLLISFLFAVIVYIVFSKGLRIFLPDGFIEDLLNLSRKVEG
jgi:putative tricarboxylic transport membrane protein